MITTVFKRGPDTSKRLGGGADPRPKRQVGVDEANEDVAGALPVPVAMQQQAVPCQHLQLGILGRQCSQAILDFFPPFSASLLFVFHALSTA